ncbi:hypothetical protein QBC37DRAFT_292038 [Rhypophila decipiens]|uniref:BTB domain-containing protein n=1 Tax=Rhypophila decipiens TaxID=261697 RepID=A0AAN6Y731_9PEZI|nr:hypothetical protein QBC37DRAFT_292038 [Rhypophila decipiens]
MNAYPPDDEEDENGVVRPPVNDVVQVLDARGDLILVVGQERKEFLVCSRTLRRASKVFDDLYSRRVEGQDGHERLDLSHIGVLPLHLVLEIIHGNHAKVNPHLTNKETLHDVLVVTHHFSMTGCLAPIAVKWLKKVYDKEPSGFHNIAVQLWITHQLGHLGCLKQTIYSMVQGGRLNSRGELIGQGATDNDEYRRFPTLSLLGVLEQVKECRSRVVAHLVNTVRDAVRNLIESPRMPAAMQTNGPAPKPTVCQVRQESPTRRRQCDSRMLGAFQRALFDQNWDKVDKPASSPYSLHRRINEVARQTLKEYDPPTDSHKHCGPFGRNGLEPLVDIVKREVDAIPFDERDFMRRGKMMGFPVGA